MARNKSVEFNSIEDMVNFVLNNPYNTNKWSLVDRSDQVYIDPEAGKHGKRSGMHSRLLSVVSSTSGTRRMSLPLRRRKQ